MTELELRWMAGWLEGEGTFYIGKGGTAAIIQVFSIDLDVLEKAHQIVGGALHYIKPRRHPQGYVSQEGWRLHLESEAAVSLMRQVLPLMGQRRTTQIKAVLRAWENRPNRPVEKLCACGCGRSVFGGPRLIYARKGACAQRALRQRRIA